jgi:MaoC like domain
VNVGDEFGPSDWLEITQERIDRFAEATDDHQWIHVDPERAAEGPFGTTIAHGFLTLSLLVRFWYEVGPEFEGYRMGINYGLNRCATPRRCRSEAASGGGSPPSPSMRSRAASRSRSPAWPSARARKSRSAQRSSSSASTAERAPGACRAPAQMRR